jgi:hypothetical protein
MAKEVSALVKLQIKGGAANPSPPVGPALGAKGVNIMEFCKQFNARTQDKPGKVLPVVITVYAFGWACLYIDFNLSTELWVYTWVAARLACPNNSFIAFKSAPLFNRLVAYE